MGDESMINQADYIRLHLQGDQLGFIAATENDNDKSTHGYKRQEHSREGAADWS